MSLATRSAFVCTLILTLAFLASAAGAQSPSGGAVSGVVTDSLDLPLQGIKLTLRSAATGASRTATTGRDGLYRFALVAPGEYDLRIEGFGYHPRWLAGLRVHAAGELRVPVRLAATDPTQARVDSARIEGSAAAGPTAGRGLLIDGEALEQLPDRSRDLAEVARLFSAVGEALAIEGLPGTMTQLRVDGMPTARSSFLLGSASPLRGMSIPWLGLGELDVATGAADVEWGGAAGGILNAVTRSGTRDFRARAFGAWSQGEFDSSVPASDALDASGMRGGLLISGPIARDTSAFVIGVETYRSPGLLHPGRGLDSLTSNFGRIAGEVYGESLPGEGWVRSLEPQVVSGFGRLDWRLSDRHHLRVGANAGAIADAVAALPAERSPFGTAVEGTELSASANLSSRLGTNLWQELRVGFERAERDYAAVDLAAAGVGLAPTLIAAGPLAAGHAPGAPAGTAQSSVRLGTALHFGDAVHRFKLGAELSVSSWESTFDDSGSGRFLFADLASFEAGEGLFEEMQPAALGTSFSVPAFGIFLQDRWSPLRDLELLLGIRWDTERLPSSDIEPNEAWLERTGIDNRDTPGAVGGFSPRGALTWRAGPRHDWVVRAAGGVFTGQLMPELIAHPLGLDDGLSVSRGAGDMGSWPAAPAADIAPVIGARIGLLDPDARAPRTTRGSLGVSRHLGAGTTIHLSGTLRRTDFLPRRSDLNLMAEPLFTDQHGRPVYGELEVVGGLLGATGASNRRFVDVERVELTSTDGWSEYSAVTAAIERTATSGLTVLGSYTFSSTRDNWSTRFPLAGSLDPFPGDSALAGWTESRSDLDVPHRAVLGAHLRLPALPAVSVAGVYRFRSGLPFTPSFARALDVNGDGFRGNDPAYVDRGVAGMDALLAEWDCLGEQEGGFAGRNSCRGDAVHSLDLRVAVRLVAGNRFSGELFVDGVDLVRTGNGEYPDPALYLLDPEGTLETDAGAGTVTLPLLANPAFGRPLAGTAPGRTIRVGLRIHY